MPHRSRGRIHSTSTSTSTGYESERSSASARSSGDKNSHAHPKSDLYSEDSFTDCSPSPSSLSLSSSSSSPSQSQSLSYSHHQISSSPYSDSSYLQSHSYSTRSPLSVCASPAPAIPSNMSAPSLSQSCDSSSYFYSSSISTESIHRSKRPKSYRVITRVDPREYNSTLYNTHLFIMRLVPPIPSIPKYLSLPLSTSFSPKRPKRSASASPTSRSTSTSASTVPSGCTPKSRLKIEARSTPQAEWDTSQCQQWLEQVLLRREGMGRREASKLSKRLTCRDGREMYRMGVDEWDELCTGAWEERKLWRGRRWDIERRDEGFERGERIWGMLMRRRGEEGL